jgi:hypothetical protein
MSEVDLNQVNSIRRDVAHYRGPSEHNECVKDLRTMLTAYAAETARADRAEAAYTELAQIVEELHATQRAGHIFQQADAAQIVIEKLLAWWQKEREA